MVYVFVVMWLLSVVIAYVVGTHQSAHAEDVTKAELEKVLADFEAAHQRGEEWVKKHWQELLDLLKAKYGI